MNSIFTLLVIGLVCFLIFIIPLTTTITIIQSSHALQQLAGPIVVQIKPGETKTFTWGLLTDKNQTNNVTLSADGVGAELLSFQKSVKLNPTQFTNVPVNVNIPSDYHGAVKLNPSIRATEAGVKVAPTTINIAMAKVLSIVVSKNANQTSNKNITGPGL